MKNMFATMICALAMMACGGNMDKGETYNVTMSDSTMVAGGTCYYNVDVVLACGHNAAARAINDTLTMRYFGCSSPDPKQAMMMWKQMSDNYFRESADAMYEWMENEPDFEPSIPNWDFDIKSYEMDSPQGMRTFSIVEYSYEGGAHGITTTQFVHFDAETGELLSMQDILGVTPEQILPTVQSAFVNQLGISMDELGESGYWTADEWTPTSEFYFDGDDVVFFFNPYEAGCYAIGTVEVRMPRESVGLCY